MTRSALEHPDWCDLAACTAGQHGMHRSAATVAAAGLAATVAVYLVLFARFDESQSLLVLATRAGSQVKEFVLGRCAATTAALASLLPRPEAAVGRRAPARATAVAGSATNVRGAATDPGIRATNLAGSASDLASQLASFVATPRVVDCPPWCATHWLNADNRLEHVAVEQLVATTLGRWGRHGPNEVSVGLDQVHGEAPLVHLDSNRQPFTPPEALALADVLQDVALAALASEPTGNLPAMNLDSTSTSTTETSR
ncbi:hypothetical protein [Actinoplanes sp. NPDC051859]|uniref:hypothetical protein n=1 Tax=Actinoplanes sp. NPDC051859 TaxID=3363909 RepID=UPI0037881B69